MNPQLPAETLVHIAWRAGVSELHAAHGEERGPSLQENVAPHLPITSLLDDPLLRLQFAHSVKDVAAALGLDPEKFFFVIQHANDGTYYRTFKIPKKSGGQRLISAPKGGLGLAQSRLASILSQKYLPKAEVKGYVKGESFLTNAAYHEKQKWVLNLDLKDFYPSITFPRVRGLFMSEYFGFNDRVATILARVTTTSDGLPQGARTSPIIANMIAANLDRKLVGIARSNRIRYTRYADDLTFSSSHKNIPTALIKDWHPEFGDREVKLGNEIIEVIESSGFLVNKEKTRIMLSYERQEVTGLIVNKSANVWRKDIARIRMILYSAIKHGATPAAMLWLGADKKSEDFWNYIAGWLSYFAQVRGRSDPVVSKLCKMAVQAKFKGPDWVKRSAELVQEYDVFLSHATEDKPKVRKLKDKLESLGVKVFFDQDSISWGDSLVEKINFGLMKSTFFVPFLTETFSQKGWTNKELNSAIMANINRKSRILPIKDKAFRIGDNYPLLTELLYKEWPEVDEDQFVAEIADLILGLVEREKANAPG